MRRAGRHLSPIRYKLPKPSPPSFFITILGRWVLSHFIILFYLFLAAPWHMELPGQGSDPSSSHNLSHSCGNAGSLTHCARGWNPVLPHHHQSHGARVGAPHHPHFSLSDLPRTTKLVKGGAQDLKSLI